jgi:fimbrial chaperone protein
MRFERLTESPAVSIAHAITSTVLALFSVAVQALTISPVLVDLSPARRIASITIANPSDRAISFQTETLAWTQPEGADRYDETEDLVVVPPIAEIPPGRSQIFRVTLRRAPEARERAYRLIFEDVTAPAPAGPSADEVAVNLRISHNLPVFVASPGTPRARPQLAPCDRTPEKGACVRLVNAGERYLQVKSLSLEGSGWHREIAAPARVLAGAWRQWTFDTPAQARPPMQLRVETPDGPFTADLPSAAR